MGPTFLLNRMFHRFIAAAGLLTLAASCTAPPAKPEASHAGASHSYWIGDRVHGSPRMVINLSRQRVLFFKGGHLVGMAPISSGRESHATRTGSYRIIQKDLNHRSSLYGNYVAPDGSVVSSDVDVRKDARPPGTTFVGAGMRYFMRITGAIGMHEGYLPGYPASHGCIRLPTRMAAVFFRAAPLGTPIQIIGDAAHAPTQPVIRPEQTEQRPILAEAPPPNEQIKKPPAAKVKAASKPARKMRLFGRGKKAPKVPPGTTLYLHEG